LPLRNKQNELDVFQAIFEVSKLVDELEVQVWSIEDEDDRIAFLRPITRFKSAAPIRDARQIPFSQVITPITEGDLIVLEFCSRHLHKHSAQPIADPQT